eukprot:10783923-Alexandrium_andersonii.AAC.1
MPLPRWRGAPMWTWLPGSARGLPWGCCTPWLRVGCSPRSLSVRQRQRGRSRALRQIQEGWENYRSAEDDAEICSGILDEM